MSDYATKYIGSKVKIVVDRPKGSQHPKFDWIYPVNYGFVPETTAPDGKEVDAYVLGVDRPVTEFKGECIAVIKREDDDDDKLIVVPVGMEVSGEDIMNQIHFQEQFFTSTILRSN